MTAGNQCECGVYSIIRELLQWNVAGTPVFHQNVDYEFDPEVSQKRRETFYEVIFRYFRSFLFNVCVRFFL